MGYSIKQTPVSEWRHDMETIQLRYQSAEIKGHMPPIDTDWDVIQRIEDSGMLVAVGAVDDDTGTMLGYAIYFVFEHAHHRGVLFGACDIIAVSPAHRDKGIATRLIEAAEPLLRGYGARYMTHGFRHVYKTPPLFEKLGFTAEETTYIKEL